VTHGLCGDSVWIADELWRMSQVRSVASREAFFAAVINVIEIGRSKEQRKPRKETPRES
jgi:hypothetical protein